MMQQAAFLFVPVIRPADVEAAFRQREVGRRDDFQRQRVDVDRGRRFHGVGKRLHRDPAAGIAAHRPAAARNRDIPERWPDRAPASSRPEQVVGLVWQGR